jgi:hypothetical protein
MKQLTHDSFQSQDRIHFVSNLIHPHVLLNCYIHLYVFYATRMALLLSYVIVYLESWLQPPIFWCYLFCPYCCVVLLAATSISDSTFIILQYWVSLVCFCVLIYCYCLGFGTQKGQDWV